MSFTMVGIGYTQLYSAWHTLQTLCFGNQSFLNIIFQTGADTLQTFCFANTRFRNNIFQTGADTLPALCFANSYVTMRSSHVHTVVLIRDTPHPSTESSPSFSVHWQSLYYRSAIAYRTNWTMGMFRKLVKLQIRTSPNLKNTVSETLFLKK